MSFLAWVRYITSDNLVIFTCPLPEWPVSVEPVGEGNDLLPAMVWALER